MAKKSAKIANKAAAVRLVFLPNDAPLGILDVERPCSSTTHFEKIGLSKTLLRNYSHESGTSFRGRRIQ
jgi:hypothetical protein